MSRDRRKHWGKTAGGLPVQSIPSSTDKAKRLAKLLTNQLLYGASNGRNRSSPSPLYSGSIGPPRGGANATNASAASSTTFNPGTPAKWQSKPYSDIPYAGIRAGELIGYRFWRYWHHPGAVDFLPGFLQSVSVPAVWIPGERMEGDIKAGFGIFSFIEPVERDVELLNWTTSVDQILIFVLGRVRLWGEVVEHELGYRSEFAEIYKLDGVLRVSRQNMSMKPETEICVPLLQRLRDLYQVANAVEGSNA